MKILLKIWLLPVLVVLLKGRSFQAAENNLKNPKPAKGIDPSKLLAKPGERSNGVRFKAKVVIEGRLKASNIRIVWTIDYNGPRPPLTILKPSLRYETSGQTWVRIFATGSDGKTRMMELTSPSLDPSYTSLPAIRLPEMDWFITVPQKKSFSDDSIVIKSSKLRNYFTTKFPKQYNGLKPPKITLQLFHNPEERGELHKLDAWTGFLYTDRMDVPLPRW
jgi:hypothetical protein